MQRSDELAERPPNVPEDRVMDIDIYAPPGGKTDFHGAWKAIKDSAPYDVVWTPRNDGHWLVLRSDLMQDVEGNPEHFSNRILYVPKSMSEHHKLLPSTLDPPKHRPYRMLLNAAMQPKKVKEWEPSVREMAVDLIEGFRAKGRCNFTTDYAEFLPINMFMKICDLPLEDGAKIKYWTDQTTRSDGEMRYEDAIQAFYDYLDPIVQERVGRDNDDLITNIVNGEVDGQTLSKLDSIEMAAQALIAGVDTVVNLLAFIMQHLAQNPEHQRYLVDNPDRTRQSAEELIRRFAVVTVAREVRHDMDYEGVQLKQGDIMVIPTPLHGLDEKINPDPMEVRFDRDRSNQHSTFGNGPHSCPGMHLGRAELRITLEEWSARIPEFELAPDTAVTFSGGIVACVDSLPLVWDPAKTKSKAA